MAEVQTTTESGELTQCFIEFVMMQQQNAAFCLGLIPNPQTGKGEVNLAFARILVNQLDMIRTKTRGNLKEDELKVLNSALSNLQLAFVEVSKKQGETLVDPASVSIPESPASEISIDEGKRKFTKSYGA